MSPILRKPAIAFCLIVLSLSTFFIIDGYAQCPASPVAPSSPPFSGPDEYCFYIGSTGCLACLNFCTRVYADGSGFKHREMIVTALAYQDSCSGLTPDSVIQQASDSLLVFEANLQNVAGPCDSPKTIVSIFQSSCWEYVWTEVPGDPVPNGFPNVWAGNVYTPCDTTAYCEHQCSICNIDGVIQYQNCFYTCLGYQSGCQDEPPPGTPWTENVCYQVSCPCQ